MSLPKGRYFVGDPCYVLDKDLNEDWNEVCNKTIPRKDLQRFGSAVLWGGVLEGQYQLESGRIFAVHSTAHGDGLYKGSDGFRYAVDSGSLGAVLLAPGELEGFRTDLGQIVEFPYTFNTYTDLNGNVHIGHIVIATGDDVERDPDDEEEY